MADAANDGAIFHLTHVIEGNDIDIARRGYKDITQVCSLCHGGDFVAFHGGLQGADGVNFGDHHARTLAP